MPAHPADDTRGGNPSDPALVDAGAASDDAGADERAPGWQAPAWLFAGIALLLGADVVADYRAGTGRLHLGFETLAVLLAAAGLGLLLQRIAAGSRRARELGGRLREARADATRSRQDAARYRAEAGVLLRGLGDAIDQQLQRWDLTPAEREVALLLLKGLALREIAGLRQTSERTVRQQSLAIYRKAGVAGRAELSAFFLEDLLAPR